MEYMADEKVSHALVNDRCASTQIQALAMAALRKAPADVAALQLAPVIREAVEEALHHGDAERLRDSLIAFALLPRPPERARAPRQPLLIPRSKVRILHGPSSQVRNEVPTRWAAFAK
jgi:hypothetical protein